MSSRRPRKISNISGIVFSFLVMFGAIASFALFGIGDHYTGTALLVSTLVLNYLLTLVVAIGLINSPKKSDLFVTFYLFIFTMFPCIGIFLYFLLGFDSIHLGYHDKYLDKYSGVYRKYRKYLIDLTEFKDLEPLPFKTFSYNQIKHDAPVYKNADIVFFSSAIDTLREITNLLEKAKHFIHLEFYLFCDGLIFEHIFSILKRKSKEGVEIKLIIDYSGNFKRLSKKSRKRIKESGIQMRVFNPFFKSNNLWWQFRNHNKILIVDNEYALCGSCNIADEYFNITSNYFQTTELSAKLSGSIVNSFTALFLTHWDLCKSESKCKGGLDSRREWSLSDLDVGSYFRKSLMHKVTKDTVAQFLDNSPISNELTIKDNLAQLIFNAKKRIIISTPYFLPPKDLVSALKQASISGVSVRILVPKNPDLINFFRTLNRQLFSVLLDQNIEIYEYFGFNHEKLMIIDDETIYFGSYNWDYRALYLNFESALLIKCRKLAESAEQFMEQQFKNSHRIIYSDLKRGRNLISIFFAAFIRLFKPFL